MKEELIWYDRKLTTKLELIDFIHQKLNKKTYLCPNVLNFFNKIIEKHDAQDIEKKKLNWNNDHYN